MENNEHNKPIVINASGRPFIPYRFRDTGLKKLIILPDYSPSRGRLPVGTVAVFDKNNHVPSPEYLGPDIGCGMLFAKFDNPVGGDELKQIAYQVSGDFQLATNILGSLGSGNHFIMFYGAVNSEVPLLKEGDNVVLIHTGSRQKGVEVFNSCLVGVDYLNAYNKAKEYAELNRSKLFFMLKEYVAEITGKDLICLNEQVHNSVEVDCQNITYRKGAMKLQNPNDIGVIPSSMAGEALVVKPKPAISDLEWSICHGTGRVISRKDAKQVSFDSTDIRQKIIIPQYISDDFILTERPECYRRLKDIEPQIKDYVKIVARLSPKAFVI